VTRKPANFSWQGLGFTRKQSDLLDRLDFYGNNGWARNPQAEVLMPKLQGDFEKASLPLARVKEAMESIGYGRQALHQLDRWESKRTTGKFGR
jgi:hypothetical protein